MNDVSAILPDSVDRKNRSRPISNAGIDLSLSSQRAESSLMAASQLNITENTPLGANLIPGGATFRVWAPAAREVYLALKQQTGTSPAAFPKDAGDLLVKDAKGFW